MKFDEAFDLLIDHEGGYVNHPSDPGGETKYGISKRAYPNEDIAGLTLERAKLIYKRDYWDKVEADNLPAEIRFDVFDVAVNSGVRTAVRMLQRAAFAEADGVIGPRTRLAIKSMNPLVMFARINGARLAFMADLPTWNTFGRGWAKRIAANLTKVA
jgi:lysozyme family protein